MAKRSASQMSFADALTFEHTSPLNAQAVVEAHPCGCVPYVDVFTYNRWLAQGFQVQRGEHGQTLTSMREETNQETGEVTKRFVSYRAFCRHQVKAIASEAPQPTQDEPSKPRITNPDPMPYTPTMPRRKATQTRKPSKPAGPSIDELVAAKLGTFKKI